MKKPFFMADIRVRSAAKGTGTWHSAAKGTGTWQQLKALPCTCPLGSRSRSWQSQLTNWSDIVFNKDAELLIVAHKGTANAASVFYSGAA